MEVGEKTLKSMLQRSNPTASARCEDIECLGCRRNEEEGEKRNSQCRVNNVNYEIECQLCPKEERQVYIRETSRNLCEPVTKGRCVLYPSFNPE